MTPTGPRLRALLVDDEAAVRGVGVRLLERLGFTVTDATSAEDAIDLVENESFAVILVDMELPDADGASFTRTVRLSRSNASTPVVAVSGSMSEATRRRFLEAGGTSCIDKPFSLATLRAGLAEWTPRGDAPPPRPAPPSSAAFDPLPLLDAACGDRALLERIITTFARDARAHLDAYRRTVETNDAKEAGRRMHQLAGAAGMVGALTLAALARAEMEAPPSMACHTLVSAELDGVLPLLEQLYR